jgi:hypothetical protein
VTGSEVGRASEFFGAEACRHPAGEFSDVNPGRLLDENLLRAEPPQIACDRSAEAEPVVPLRGWWPVFRTLDRIRERARERRLPPDERQAARAERQAEEQMRRERDKTDERARQVAAAEAERRRYGGGGTGGYGGGPGF